MTNQGDYDLKPQENAKPKPGEPGWVEPIPVIVKPDVPEGPTSPTTDSDIEKYKGLAILGYILFVIPLIAAPQSKFARFHANQGLLVFLSWMAALVVATALVVGKIIVSYFFTSSSLWFIPMFCGCVSYVLPSLMFLGTLVLAVIGIVNAANGEQKQLPLIGQWTLIK